MLDLLGLAGAVAEAAIVVNRESASYRDFPGHESRVAAIVTPA
jgi:hypothetical protein